jgi:hypothetical protein
LFNVGDALVVHNFNPNVAKHTESSPQSMVPIRVVTFPGTLVTAIAHREVTDANDRDLLVGLANGEVVCASLRALITDRDGRSLPPGTLRFNTDGGGGIGNSGTVVREIVGGGDPSSLVEKKEAARCTNVSWFDDDDEKNDFDSRNDAGRPRSRFLSTHADGNAYVYLADRGDAVDPCFCKIEGKEAIEAVSVTPARDLKTANPLARWRVGGSAIAAAAVAPGGEAVAFAGADGVVRVLDVRVLHAPVLIDGFKSHFGGVDAVAWAMGPRGEGAFERGGNETVFGKRLGRFSERRAEDARNERIGSHPLTPRFILAGGEADIVEVWDRSRRAVIARAQGHASWITAIAETPETPRFAGAFEARRLEKSGGVVDSEAFADHDASEASIDHRYDDLLAPDIARQTLKFASTGQDCRLCVWEVEVDPAPRWWRERESRSEAAAGPTNGSVRAVSVNVDVPGASRGIDDDDDDDDDDDAFPENDPSFGESPPRVPQGVPLGRPPEAASSGTPGWEKTVSVSPAPAEERKRSVSLLSGSSGPSASSLMFPTLRDFRDDVGRDARDADEVSRKGVAGVPARSFLDCVGDGKPVASAASRSTTPRCAPLAAHKLHNEPCMGLAFVEEGILTSCGGGVVKLWRRAE